MSKVGADSEYSQAFQEMDEDQYDFHAYCLRKQTLNAYIEYVNKTLIPSSITGLLLRLRRNHVLKDMLPDAAWFASRITCGITPGSLPPPRTPSRCVWTSLRMMSRIRS